jgi:hypothetical protein
MLIFLPFFRIIKNSSFIFYIVFYVLYIFIIFFNVLSLIIEFYLICFNFDRSDNNLCLVFYIV